MPTYYIDPDWTGTESGTEAEPYSSWANASTGESGFASGDTVLIQGGGTLTEQITIPHQEFTISTYGTGLAVIDGEDIRDYCIECEDKGTTLISIENLDCKRAVTNACRFTITSASSTNLVTFHANNCIFRETSGTGTVDVGTGFLSITTSYGGANPYIVLTDCEFSNNAKHGFDGRGVCRGYVIRGTAYGNGALSTGHGFSCHPLSTGSVGITDGWTNLSGDIYYRDTVSVLDTVAHVTETTQTNRALVESASAYDSISAWEWKQNSNQLYINIGSDPGSGAYINYTRQDFGPLYFDDCESYENVNYTTGEGHGFSVDNMSGNVYFRRCHAHDNVGHGFSCWQGYSMNVISCISDGNASEDNSDIFVGRGTINCSVLNTTVSDGYAIGIFVAGSTNTSIKNCIAYNNVSYGFRNQFTSYNDSFGINISYGNGDDNFYFFSGDTDIETDPLLGSDNKPQKGSSAYRTGEYVSAYRDYNGRPFHIPPSIGAYEFTSGFPTQTRLTSSARTATSTVRTVRT